MCARCEPFLDGRVVLHAGDSRDVLKTIPDCSIDSIVTDPPYALVSIVKRFGKPDSAPAKGNEAYMRASAGFMGKQWDTGETAFDAGFWAECLRVLKPGGHVVAFSGTRTYHRMACAIEDAGFEIRDMLSWLYGSGFPKSHDVSKNLDRAAGAERERVSLIGGALNAGTANGWNGSNPHSATAPLAGTRQINDAITAAAIQWQGWGTALKPACEPILLGRKPLSEGTVAANVLRWGTGAINVDGCRVGTEEVRSKDSVRLAYDEFGTFKENGGGTRSTGSGANNLLGRWPANVIHDGSEDVVAAFPESEGQQGDVRGTEPSEPLGLYGRMAGRVPFGSRNDSGSAARFFYTAKADADDRLGSKHPTVKPVDLMQWICRLVTPPGGTILDCFAGTGTTAEAAFREGFNAVLIEAEPEYQADIRRRMALVLSGPDERSRESVKAKNLPRDDGPLFAPRETWDEMWARPFDWDKYNGTKP